MAKLSNIAWVILTIARFVMESILSGIDFVKGLAAGGIFLFFLFFSCFPFLDMIGSKEFRYL